MEYKIYQMDFYNGVRFGEGNLDSTSMAFHADTLFAALFQESLKIGKDKVFLDHVKKRKIIFSDAFPYKKGQFFIPKPIAMIEQNTKQKKGDSVEKKMYKKMQFIPIEYVENYIKGEFPKEYLEDCKEFGKVGLKTSVKIQREEDPRPYRVSTFYFAEGNGLYIIAIFDGKDALLLFEELMESLSYSGLGGKRSSGLGRFEFLEKNIPREIKDKLETTGKINMLLSVSLPNEYELEKVLENASYSLIRRGGFVDSATYSQQSLRKRERYLFASGSCFQTKFLGNVIEEQGGNHPLYRYEQALFLGVNI